MPFHCLQIQSLAYDLHSPARACRWLQKMRKARVIRTNTACKRHRSEALFSDSMSETPAKLTAPSGYKAVAAGLLASLFEGIRCSQHLAVWRRSHEIRLKNTWCKSPIVTNRIRTAGRKTCRKARSACWKSGNRERRRVVLIPSVTVEAFIVLKLGFFCLYFSYRHLGKRFLSDSTVLPVYL